MLERKMRKIVDRLTGGGILKKDHKYIADVEYNLTVYQEYIILDDNRRIETTKEITGYFNIIAGDAGNEIFDTFVLELTDGRSLGVNTTRQDSIGKKYTISINDASNYR